jgi:hypothetical protein
VYELRTAAPRGQARARTSWEIQRIAGRRVWRASPRVCAIVDVWWTSSARRLACPRSCPRLWGSFSVRRANPAFRRGFCHARFRCESGTPPAVGEGSRCSSGAATWSRTTTATARTGKQAPRPCLWRRAGTDQTLEVGPAFVAAGDSAGLGSVSPVCVTAAFGWEWLSHGVVELRGVAGKLGTRSRQGCRWSVDLVALVVEHAGNHLRERSLASGLPANPQPHRVTRSPRNPARSRGGVALVVQ